MRLNMTILHDRLAGLSPASSKLGDRYELPLEGCRLWRKGANVSPTIAYVVTPDELPPLPASGHIHLLCAGTLPDRYRASNHALWIEFASEMDRADILDQAAAAFTELSDWDARITNACLTRASIEEIAQIAFEPFDNNFSCFDTQGYTLFSCHKPNDSYIDQYPEQNEYLSQEDMEKLFETEEYRKALNSKLPAFFPRGAWECDSIVCNLFDGNDIIARLTIDGTQRPFYDSDWTLLWHVGNIIREVLLQWDLLRVGVSREFDAMLAELVDKGSAITNAHEQVLANAGWSLDDVYRCMVIVPKDGLFSESAVSQSSLFIQRHMDNVYMSGNTKRLLAIANVGRRRGMREDTEQLERFLRTNGYLCSVSREFRGFGRIKAFFGQAWQTLAAGIAANTVGPIYRFDEFALDIMLSNASGDFPPADYIIPQLHALIAYDREHESELLQTLVTYIKGSMNVTATINRLHVHKTTFYYRLRRIEEISGLSLDDYRTVLYLMIVFETVEGFRVLSLA